MFDTLGFRAAQHRFGVCMCVSVSLTHKPLCIKQYKYFKWACLCVKQFCELFTYWYPFFQRGKYFQSEKWNLKDFRWCKQRLWKRIYNNSFFPFPKVFVRLKRDISMSHFRRDCMYTCLDGLTLNWIVFYLIPYIRNYFNFWFVYNVESSS